MRDPVLAELMGLEEVNAETCAECHRTRTPSLGEFQFASAVQLVCNNRLRPVEGGEGRSAAAPERSTSRSP